MGFFGFKVVPMASQTWPVKLRPARWRHALITHQPPARKLSLEYAFKNVQITFYDNFL